MKYLLSFKGKKKDLHKDFKKYCKKQGFTMNARILNLIKRDLKINN